MRNASECLDPALLFIEDARDATGSDDVAEMVVKVEDIAEDLQCALESIAVKADEHEGGGGA